MTEEEIKLQVLRGWFLTISLSLLLISLLISQETTMRSPLALLLFGCVALLPQDALGRLVPIYVWRNLPTSSPTSSPSYQPSFRPSSRPTSHPSSSPTISRPPSPQPSYHPSSSPTSTSFMTSKSSVNSEEMFLPSTFGFWLAMSLIGILLCVVGVGFQLVRKSNCWQSKWCQRSNDEQKRGKDGGRSSVATLPPVKAGGGMLSSFISAVPSRLEELSVYSGSDSDEESLNSLPKEHLRRVTSTGSSVRSQSPNIRNAKRYDFMRRKPDDRNPKSGLGLQQSHISHGRRDDRDTGEIAGQIIQQKTEELGNAVKETLGQAFTGLSAIAENTIFPVDPNDRTRKQNHHQRSSDQHHARRKQSHYRSDEVDAISASNKSGGSSITSRESISASSRSSSSADSASTSFASQDEPASSKMSGSAAASSDGGATSDEDDDSTAVSQQSVASFDKSVYNAIMSTLHSSTLLTPIHVTLTDNSSQAASHVGFKRGDNHFSLQIVAEEFDGLTVARRNRLIYMLLGNTMEKIQSLEIDARSPSEM